MKTFAINRVALTSKDHRYDVSRSGIIDGSLYRRPNGPLIFAASGSLCFTPDDLRELADRMDAIGKGETPL